MANKAKEKEKIKKIIGAVVIGYGLYRLLESRSEGNPLTTYTGPRTCVVGSGIGNLPNGGICNDAVNVEEVLSAVEYAWKEAKNRSSGNPLTTKQKSNIKEIITAWNNLGDGHLEKLYYILATALHESDFVHLKEKRHSPDSPYYATQTEYWNTGYMGRGFVHITWKKNYEKFGRILGIDLVNKPDLAEIPSVAAKIIVFGMYNGTFTSKALGHYINNMQKDYYNARKIILGLNNATNISKHATNIESKLA